MHKKYFFIFLFIIPFLTAAEIVIADNESERADLLIRIEANENLISQKQDEIDAHKLSLAETRKIYKLGLDKHKEMSDIGKDIKKKIRPARK